MLSSKNALSPKFTNSAAVSEKEVSSPDKDKERLWERERVRGGSEISSLLERRRFWCKAVLIVCMKLFISRQAAQESIRQREVVRRRDAALLIERVYLCVRARRYATMQLRILVRHKGAVKMLRQAVSVSVMVGERERGKG